ncbi:hypothetical protein MSSAC_0780 [Methanosarcina siciliae C2J]|uniref:Uncharacterized protein n=1 Tax=Methanosarcina siciliae C2J TaxID=1434118 RepID=A0A0E3PJT9_9EURY|nr:hypothetical protein [Methanosarcina siciliae]AKB35370.1 hypothetical protein MSSAC_0780 [Methanosarcina siciliae C2J]
MIKMRVSSCMCSFCHTVTGKVKGDRIIIKIDTPCEKFRNLTCLEFPLQELPENQSELILELERQTDCSFGCTRECALDCTRRCLIPDAVLNAVSIGKRLAKKKLAETEIMKVEITSSEFAEAEIAAEELAEIELIKIPFLGVTTYTTSEFQ